MNKILFISREFYPMANASTTCLENILQHLGRQQDIHLITAKRKVLSKKKEKRFNITIYRYSKWLENAVYVRNSLIDFISGKKIPVFLLNPVRRILLSMLKPIQPYLEKEGLYYPKAWEKNLVTHLINNKDINEYSWVFAIGFPYDNVQIAYELKNLYPHLKLGIIEFDLFTDNPVTILKDTPETYSKRLKRENEWYRLVDKLIVTSEVYKSLMENQSIQISKENTIEIEMPVLRDISNKLPSKKSIKKEKNSVNLVYTGMFYEEIRRPDFMFEVLGEIFKKNPHIKLHIIGFGCNELIYKYRELYPENIYFYGKKSKEFCTNAIIEADFLVNLGNRTTSQAPSKIIEYIGCGKPIINFYNLDKDLCVEFLKKYPFSISIKETSTKLPDKVNEVDLFINKFSNFNAFSTAIFNEFNDYRPEVVANKIQKIMGEII